MPTTTLDHQLQAALDSREERNIRRSLPEPISVQGSSSSHKLDFTSNDYLGLARNPKLEQMYLSKLTEAPQILGSTGSRLLVNGSAHLTLEKRLAEFYGAPSALLFNSGLDANIGFFSCVPQRGDIIVTDEYIHASVHDGIRQSRARDAHVLFTHNSVKELREVLRDSLAERPGLRAGRVNCFVAVESLYSMDGTFAPLREITELVESLFPAGNGYIIVDEAHTTGI